MTRGGTPSAFEGYRGRAGQTSTRVVHVSNGTGALVAARVYATVNVEQDPELAARLLGTGEPLGATLDDGSTLPIAAPVVYHDPRAEVFALVLPDGDRHRELACRIELLQRLQADEATIPAYAVNFAVVFGAAGLRAYLASVSRAAARSISETVAPRFGAGAGAGAGAGPGAGAGAGEDARAPRAARMTQARIRGSSEPPSTQVARTISVGLPGGVAASAAAAASAASAAALDAATAAAPPAEMPAQAELLAALDSAFDVPATGRGAALTTSSTPGRGGSMRRATVPPPMAGEPVGPVAVFAVEPAPSEPRGDVTMIAPAPTRPPTAEPIDAARHALDDSAAPPPAAPEVDTRPTARAATDIGINDAPVPPAVAQPVADADMPDGADPVVTEFLEVEVVAADASDEWFERWRASGAASALALLGPEVRIAARVVPGRAERLRQGAVDVLLTHHRTDAGPLVGLALGTPASLRRAERDAVVLVFADVTDDVERAAIAALGRDFAITIDLLFADGARRRGRLVGRLAENAGFVLRAADDHRRAVASGGGVVDAARARAALAHPDVDVFGRRHPDAEVFDEAAFARLTSATLVLRAIASAAYFTEPAQEDYLVCTRGYALSRWREVRRGVLARAVEWGLWMGPELARVAISEGFARSRRDLIARLGAGFDLLRTFPQFCDLSPDESEANLRALAAEAEAVGGGGGAAPAGPAAVPTVEAEVPVAEPEDIGAVEVEASGAMPVASPEPRRQDAAMAAAVSGTIDTQDVVGHRQAPSIDELIARLDDRSERLEAAVALCERADPRALEPVMVAVGRMSRAEAVRVLGMMVRFGTAAGPVLATGLTSSKAFLRHGCALALAMLRTEAGTEAVIELLMREPTEIWREVARAVGQVGPAALMPLASALGRLGDRASASARERVAWAMAHVAVRGGRSAVEALAAGQSIVAPVAVQAVGLIAPASRDEIRLRPGAASGGTQPGREVTVNRAFSKRFFEAVERGLPAVGMAELSAMEAAEPMELLDEADLVEEDDGEALDERDLLT